MRRKPLVSALLAIITLFVLIIFVSVALDKYLEPSTSTWIIFGFSTIAVSITVIANLTQIIGFFENRRVPPNTTSSLISLKPSNDTEHQNKSSSLQPHQLSQVGDTVTLSLVVDLPLPNGLGKSKPNVVQITNDSKWVVCGLSEDKIVVWDIDTYSFYKLGTLARSDEMAKRQGWPMYSLSTSRDSKFLASPTERLELQIWSLPKLRPLHQLETFNHSPISVDFSPNGNWLVAGLDKDGYISSWSIQDNFRRVENLRAHSGRVTVVKFHPKSSCFVSGASDGTLHYWQINNEEMEQLFTFKGHDLAQIQSVAFTSTGHLIATGSSDGEICVWSSESGELMHRWDATVKNQPIRTLHFLPNTEILFSGANDRTLRAWDIESHNYYLSKKFEGSVRSIYISQDGKKLALCADGYRSVSLWSIGKADL